MNSSLQMNDEDQWGPAVCLLSDGEDEAPVFINYLVDFALGNIEFALDVIQIVFGSEGIVLVFLDVFVHFGFIAGHGMLIFA